MGENETGEFEWMKTKPEFESLLWRSCLPGLMTVGITARAMEIPYLTCPACPIFLIAKTSLLKYTENFTSKK